MTIKKMLPKTFFGRSLAIIIIPMLILQTVLTYFFYERHWEDVGRRLVLGLGGQLAFLISELENEPSSESNLFFLAEQNFLIKSKVDTINNFADYRQHKIKSLLDKTLSHSLKERLNKPYKFDTRSLKDRVQIFVKTKKGIVTFEVARKTLHSSTIEVFIIWMISTSILLIFLALYFMRKQINPLHNIMKAAEEFGKGNNNFKLAPKGSHELRMLAKVFTKMRERIKNQIKQRTLMLAGIGHDLRTPLTRMKLQIALLKDKSASGSLTNDVEEMKDMIDSYLAFAKGEGEEENIEINIYKFFQNIVKKNNNMKKVKINFKVSKKDYFSIKPLAMKRALNNLLSNALFYAKKKVLITVTSETKKGILITFEDDGPGIPLNKRKDVIKAFYRVDQSRLSNSANTGLGLTITKNIVNGHGGNLELKDSHLGGLAVNVFLPN
ncbi:MAG: Osmolarity sensor protein EnvZ [Alphaproteobacteria bacterium MarineAlpha9_Bin4]|nr:hypothetical protein [Pelagibacterales bacterium]PPR26301.1 MAG: Osmolarity sensor protein EnvZ [Alphaproteobacteria bacterium MarineAlpha9_Bin4]|tara:strand:- start:125 stop:1438 length:1314 start_codon:yes stop_codon:yes gene_type:complete